MLRITLLLFSPCLFVVLLGGGCGDLPDSHLIVNVINAPARTVKLSVEATIDGKRAMNTLEPSPWNRFGLEFPGSLSGRLNLSAIAYDSDNCTQANAQGAADLPVQLSDVTLAMTAKSPRSCGALGACAAGTLCPFTLQPQPPDILGLWLIAPDNIWAVGGNRTILHFDGNGWTYVTSGGADRLHAVWASGPNDIWVVGSDSKMPPKGFALHSTNGTTFMQVQFPNSYIPSRLYSVWGIGTSDLWVVGDNAEFWHRDGGNNWTKLPTPQFTTMDFLSGVWANTPNDVWACGTAGKVLHYTSTMTTAQQIGSSSDNFDAIWGSPSGQIYAVGAEAGGAGAGIIYRYTGTWAKIPVTSAALNSAFGNSTTVYAVGKNGTLLYSTAPFSSFQTYTTGLPTTELKAIQPGSNGIVWVGGFGGYLGYFDLRP